MRNRLALLSALTFASFLACSSAGAQSEAEERIVVTGSRISVDPPGVWLTRRADFLLVEVDIINDSLTRERREDELRQTLEAVLAAAARDPSISVSMIFQEEYVVPVSAGQTLAIQDSTTRRDTSYMRIQLKSALSPDTGDGSAVVEKLKNFIGTVTPAGRTIFSTDSEVMISIVNPNQYRGELIRLAAEDMKTVLAQIGEGYRVNLNGIDKPVHWTRTGLLDVALYIPYRYDVIPDTMTTSIQIDN